MYDAIYARQSVEKSDSISVESQVEFCEYETRGNKYKKYIDKGFSGKNTNRPAYEKMMCDIKNGIISRVIVYKLDRISRSILDFSNMMEMFQKYKVEFISSTEKFDTSSPIGRAMLNICIVFAQLERETIQKRISDAYYSRSKKGFYMGGKVPYGFSLEKIKIDGVKTSKYVPVDKEINHIKLMYSIYSSPNKTLGDVIRYFKENNIKNSRGNIWRTARISEILKRPIYVKADKKIYNFYKNQGVSIINDEKDFTGENACYIYKENDNCKYLVLAPHKGIVSSSEWLKCTKKHAGNSRVINSHKVKNTWLAGKIKCGNCGYAVVVRKSSRKENGIRYFLCSRKNLCKECSGCGSIRADDLELFIFRSILRKISYLQILSKELENESEKINLECEEKKLKIEKEIDMLLEKIPLATGALVKYINERITKLNLEKEKIVNDLLIFKQKHRDKFFITDKNLMLCWEKMSVEHKILVVDAFIKKIRVFEKNIEIIWKI